MAEQDPSRGSPKETESDIVLDVDTLAEVQRGKYQKPSFFGDMSSASSMANFKSGLDAVNKYVPFASSAINTVSSRSENYDNWSLTNAEYNEIKKLASSIATYGNTPYQTIVDFLVILCSINKISDMKKIVTVVEIEELNNESILREPMEILAIPELYKIAYMASALDSLIKLFSRFLNSSNNTGVSDSDDISGLVSNIGSLLGGLSGAGNIVERLENFSAEDALGHFMSELLEGKRIPMPIIAKNPMKEAPSYIGQALFGESPASLSLVDMTEIFNKKIGVFPKPSSGSGKSSFGMQNFSSLGGSMDIQSFVNKMNFGGNSITSGSYKETKINEIVEVIKTITGVTDAETFSVNSADVAIPLQIAMSASNCGLEKSPFSSSTFQNGWQAACNVSNHMQNTNSEYLRVIRGLT